MFSGELISLFLYSLQQLGVMLGVGSETILLLAYLISMRDGVVEKTEARFSHAIERVLNAGLILIILSGLGIVSLHLAAGESNILFEPIFLFKWLLIGILVVLTILIQSRAWPQERAEMLAGGTWYALFIVHILAPITTWANLFLLYGVWIVGFGLTWYGLTRFTKTRVPSKQTTVGYGDFAASKSPEVASPSLSKPPPVAVSPTPPPSPPPPPPPPKPTPVKAAPPPPPPKPVAPPVPKIAPVPVNLPVATHVELNAPKPPVKPVVPAPKSAPVHTEDDVSKSPFMQPIRVMPKTEEDAKKHAALTFGH